MNFVEPPSGYGLTEASPNVAMTPLNCKIKYGAVGQLIPNLEAKIIDLETGATSRHLSLTIYM